MRPSRPPSSATAGSNTSPPSWAATPRRLGRAWWNWRARATWTRAAPGKGGGRRRLIATDASIEANFLKVLEDHPAGDPMRLDLRWTNLSRRQIAGRVTELGTPIGRHVASQLLHKHRYRTRQGAEEED